MDLTLETTAAVSIESVYREHGARLWRSVLLYAGDREIANDAVSEAFAQALGRGPAIRDPARWVWRSAFRIAAGQLQDRSRLRGDMPEPSYEIPDALTALSEGLAQLPARQRAAVVLHYYADLPIRQVAHALATTSPAVKMTLMRARRRLRTYLEADDA